MDSMEVRQMQRNLLEYLDNTAARVPCCTAVVDEKESFTFSLLRQRSRCLGTHLANITRVHNRPIAVLTDRGADSVLAFMGVLYSGNYYVPVDVRMPAARMAALMEQIRPAALVLAAKKHEPAQQFAHLCPLVSMEEIGEDCDDALLASVRGKVLDVDPAYIIFTSGSTGVPKGIVVSHRSVIDFTDWYTETCGITGADILGNQAPFYFDLSVKDLYSTMKCGATMHILPQKFFSFPMLLMQYLKEQKITTLSWATSAFHLVANSGVLEKLVPEDLRRVILGGEALQAKQLNIWRRALPDVQYINLYGPTEVTVDCCYYKIDREFADTDIIPIGKACENMEVFLLDEQGNPVPKGTPGELCARGSGLAQGYYGDWEKTNAVFTQDPRNPWYCDRIYHTGDMAMEDEDGNFLFLARKDNQIKHSGYRIELGEVETALNSLLGINAAICCFDPQKDKIHCIYQGEGSVEEVVTGARSLLPKYMLPNTYHKVEHMPYNANGKIDRVALTKEFLHEEN